jgi:hypothetical protein
MYVYWRLCYVLAVEIAVQAAAAVPAVAEVLVLAQKRVRMALRLLLVRDTPNVNVIRAIGMLSVTT